MVKLVPSRTKTEHSVNGSVVSHKRHSTFETDGRTAVERNMYLIRHMINSTFEIGFSQVNGLTQFKRNTINNIYKRNLIKSV